MSTRPAPPRPPLAGVPGVLLLLLTWQALLTRPAGPDTPTLARTDAAHQLTVGVAPPLGRARRGAARRGPAEAAEQSIEGPPEVRRENGVYDGVEQTVEVAQPEEHRQDEVAGRAGRPADGHHDGVQEEWQPAANEDARYDGQRLGGLLFALDVQVFSVNCAPLGLGGWASGWLLAVGCGAGQGGARRRRHRRWFARRVHVNCSRIALAAGGGGGRRARLRLDYLQRFIR